MNPSQFLRVHTISASTCSRYKPSNIISFANVQRHLESLVQEHTHTYIYIYNWLHEKRAVLGASITLAVQLWRFCEHQSRDPSWMFLSLSHQGCWHLELFSLRLSGFNKLVCTDDVFKFPVLLVQVQSWKPWARCNIRMYQIFPTWNNKVSAKRFVWRIYTHDHIFLEHKSRGPFQFLCTIWRFHMCSQVAMEKTCNKGRLQEQNETRHAFSVDLPPTGFWSNIEFMRMPKT